MSFTDLPQHPSLNSDMFSELRNDEVLGQDPFQYLYHQEGNHLHFQN